MTDHERHGQILLRSVELSGGPEKWAEDMCLGHGSPVGEAPRLFALAWSGMCCDKHRLGLGAAFIDLLRENPAVMAPDKDASARLASALAKARALVGAGT